MPQADDFYPFDIGMTQFKIIRQAIRGFSNHLEISDNRIDSFFIVSKCFTVEISNITFYLPNRFKNVGEEQFRISSRHQSAPIELP